MTLLSLLTQAAFWDHSFCLDCQEVVEESPCPECGEENLPTAKSLVALVGRVAQEEVDEGDEN